MATIKVSPAVMKHIAAEAKDKEISKDAAGESLILTGVGRRKAVRKDAASRRKGRKISAKAKTKTKKAPKARAKTKKPAKKAKAKAAPKKTAKPKAKKPARVRKSKADKTNSAAQTVSEQPSTDLLV